MKKAPEFPLKICFHGGKVLFQKLTFCLVKNNSPHQFIKYLSLPYLRRALPTSRRESANTRSLSWVGNRQQIIYFRINLTFPIINSSKAPATTKQWVMALPDFKYHSDRYSTPHTCFLKDGHPGVCIKPIQPCIEPWLIHFRVSKVPLIIFLRWSVCGVINKT